MCFRLIDMYCWYVFPVNWHHSIVTLVIQLTPHNVIIFSNWTVRFLLRDKWMHALKQNSKSKYNNIFLHKTQCSFFQFKVFVFLASWFVLFDLISLSSRMSVIRLVKHVFLLNINRSHLENLNYGYLNYE